MNDSFSEHCDTFRSMLTQRYGVDASTYDAQMEAVRPFVMPFCARKGVLLQKTGMPAKNLYWIGSGVARIGFTSESGGDVTARFFVEGDLAVAYDQLIDESTPALHYIVAETDVTGFCMSWSDQRRLRSENKECTLYAMRAMEYRIRKMALHHYVHSTASARNRLRAFREEYPGLEQRVSQKVIASYLGVTPQYLSQLLHQHQST